MSSLKRLITSAGQNKAHCFYLRLLKACRGFSFFFACHCCVVLQRVSPWTCSPESLCCWHHSALLHRDNVWSSGKRPSQQHSAEIITSINLSSHLLIVSHLKLHWFRGSDISLNNVWCEMWMLYFPQRKCWTTSSLLCKYAGSIITPLTSLLFVL